jgi:hypothetical protein
MYWWNVSKLAEDFRDGRVEERERLKYYLATSISWTLGRLPILNSGSTFKMEHLIAAVLVVASTIIGIILCYRANKSGDNTDFIGRMVCLSWPIGIKVGVLFSAFMIVFLIIFGIAVMQTGFDSGALKYFTVATTIGIAFLQVCFYWLLYKYVTLIAHAKGAEEAG